MSVSTNAVLGAVMNGLATGMLLFLIAIGLTLIFGVLGVLNFAHGSLYMLGAYFTFFLVTGTGTLGLFEGRFWLTVLLAALFVAIIGGFLERVIISRVYDADHSIQILLTFALVLIIDNGVRFVWGTSFRSVEVPSVLNFQLNALGLVLPAYNLFLIAAGATMALLLWAVFRFTKAGKIVRAAAEDRDTTSALGINVPLVFTSVFVAGSALAGLGGALAAPFQSVQPAMGENIIINAFIVVVVGGLGSFAGTLVAALLIGIVRALTFLVEPRAVAFIPFALMAVVLLVRPEGLFGEAAE